MNFKTKCGAMGFLAGFVFMAVFAGNVFAWDDPKATFTMGAKSNSNLKSKPAPDEISDKINDVSLKVSFPHQLKKKTDKLNIDLNFNQDWKKDNEASNSRSTSVKFGLTHTYSKKLSLAAAYTYSDFDSFLSSAINLTISPKFSKTNSAKIDYTYKKNRFPNKGKTNMNAVNQIIKLDYKIQLTPKTSLTPFVSYEDNSVPGVLSSEYKGPTAGLRYEWKMSKKTTLTTSFDLRVKDFDNPSITKLTFPSTDTVRKTDLINNGWDCSTVKNTFSCIYASGKLTGLTNAQADTYKSMLWNCSGKSNKKSCIPPNVTRVEKRGQISIGLKYAYQKNTDFNIKYIHYKNNVDSNAPGYGATKEYNTDMFSISVSLKSLKAKKPKKKEDETKKGGEE